MKEKLVISPNMLFTHVRRVPIEDVPGRLQEAAPRHHHGTDVADTRASGERYFARKLSVARHCGLPYESEFGECWDDTTPPVPSLTVLGFEPVFIVVVHGLFSRGSI